jgi:hypothetical protein
MTEQERSLPQSLEEVSVQLIYSEGQESAAIENFWHCYLIALAPFVLGVPSSQVELFLADDFRGINSSKIDAIVADNFVDAEGDVYFLSDAYKDYFKEIYARASSQVEDIATFPPRSIRIIAGHGFGNYAGGHIVCGGKKVGFGKLGSNATVLTILDICNSPHAVASFTGRYPISNPRKFNSQAKRKIFSEDIATTIPIACDQNEAVWAFRVGYNGQHTSHAQDSFRGMSAPFGDSVTCCILAAIKSFMANSLDDSITLDDLFSAKYSALRTSFLPVETRVLRPFSDLGGLQRLISSEVLQLNLQAYECELFRRENEWFLTTERALALSPDQDKLASCIIDFVADQVKSWHELYPDSLEVLNESEDAWKRLKNSLGPFSHQLKLVAFEFDEDSKTLYRAPGGIPLEEWAFSCGGLPKCVERVWRIIETGELDMEEEPVENVGAGYRR